MTSVMEPVAETTTRGITIDGAYAQIEQHLAAISELRAFIGRALAEREQQVLSRVHEARNVQISAAEMRIVPYLVGPLGNGEIARELYISENTVKTHLKNIYRKLGVGSRREARIALGGGRTS